jgi:hypothetical protein
MMLSSPIKLLYLTLRNAWPHLFVKICWLLVTLVMKSEFLFCFWQLIHSGEAYIISIQITLSVKSFNMSGILHSTLELVFCLLK